MTDKKRLIELDFPLEQASLDSVHEKNVRHGHISTLHIWPARRPLSACRAALLATLLPDPGTEEERRKLLEKIGGRVVNEGGKDRTEGGVLHWGREDAADMEWFRQEIRRVYGRAPRVLDPFAGGGAIPLEAMRLGCEASAVDINPVAWFILKCTLEYPQKLAGQRRRLPAFAFQDRDFLSTYLKSLGLKEKDIQTQVELLGKRKTVRSPQDEMFERHSVSEGKLSADLPWHVRAWSHWVFKRARKRLAKYYPTYAEFCSIRPYARVSLATEYEDQLKLVPTNEEGEAQ